MQAGKSRGGTPFCRTGEIVFPKNMASLRTIHTLFHMKHDTNKKASPCRLQATSRRRTEKFFGAAVFQKCCRGVGEQPTFAEQITEPNNEMKQKSRRESKEPQLPLKSKGCNEIQGFRGNCGSKGKLGMCPSLAEPYAIGFPKTSRRRNESFLIQQFFKNVGEVQGE